MTDVRMKEEFWKICVFQTGKHLSTLVSRLSDVGFWEPCFE
jgi:hypothetical protein